MAYKQSQVEKLLKSSNEIKVKEGLRLLYPVAVQNPETIVPHLKTLKSNLGYLSAAPQATVLDLFARLSERRPDLFSDTIKTIPAIVNGTIAQSSKYKGNYTAGGRALDLATNATGNNKALVDPNLINITYRCFQPPIYNPEVSTPDMESLYRSAARFMAKCAALRPDLVGAGSGPEVLANIYLDTYRVAKFKQKGNRVGSLRQGLLSALKPLTNAYPSRMLPIFINLLSDRQPQEKRSGSAAFIASMATSPQAVKGVFTMIEGSDLQTSRLAAVAAVIFLQKDPKRTLPYLTAGLQPTSHPRLRLGTLGILTSAGNSVPRMVFPVLGSLVTALQDQSPQIRTGAIQAISAITAKEPEACEAVVPWMIKMLNDPDHTVSWAAVNGIAGVAHSRPDLVKPAAPYLLKFVNDPQKKFKAIEVLIRLGIDANGHAQAINSLESVWTAMSEWVKVGYDCSDIDDILQKARDHIKRMEYPQAVQVIRSASQAIGGMANTHIPIVEVGLELEQGLVMGKWNSVLINLTNKGKCTAHNVRISSPILVNTQDMIVVSKLPVGQSHDLSIRWDPHVSGTVPLQLTTMYQDPLGNAHQSLTEVELEISEPVTDASPYTSAGYSQDFALDHGYGVDQEHSYAQTETPHEDVVETEAVEVGTFSDTIGKDLLEEPEDDLPTPTIADPPMQDLKELASMDDLPEPTLPEPTLPEPTTVETEPTPLSNDEKLNKALEAQKQMHQEYDLDGIIDGILKATGPEEKKSKDK